MDSLTVTFFVPYQTEESDYTQFECKDYPIFSDLYNIIEKPTQLITEMVPQNILQELRLFIYDCAKGSLGAVLNGHTNMVNSKLVCFSLMELLEGSKERMQAVLFNITTYIWNRVSRREEEILLSIDELYLFFENLTMLKYIRSFIKRCRKYNAIMGVGTQQLGDMMVPGLEHYTTAIFGNAAFKYLFYPEQRDLALMQKVLKLTDGETKKISTPKQRHCLVCAGASRYYMKTGTLKYEELLFGTAGGL